ncbi:MAG: hypothetical protein QOD86_2474 [Miltoncostaeaceae bacterium]|jgi:hypothetical protein|nr:hypothetical protein [Miltoncostaeaceae bacterium]
MSPMWTDLRRAPMWRIALGVALAAVALNLLLPEGPQSVGGIAAAALGFMAFALILVAMRGADAWTLLGLMLVLGAVLRATDLAIGSASVLYVVMVTVATHVLCTLRLPSARPARPSMPHR